MPLLWEDDKGAQWETHTGLVVSGPHTRCVRIMSDTYSDEQYAQVWDAAAQRIKEVHIGGTFELNTMWATVVVDAPEHVMTLTRQAEAERKAAEAREDEEAAAKREVLAPCKDRTVQVVGGRKVPKGTTGTVFWTDAPTNPARLGIKDANDTTHWVDARWCEVVYADFPVGGAPACGWVAYRDALRAQEEGRKATLPKVQKGDTVTLTTTGLTGTVFWTKGTRLGVRFSNARDAAGNYIDRAWADLAEVLAVNGVSVEGTAPVAPAPEPVGDTVFDEAGAPLPWPYSAIDKVGLEDGLYAAYDAKGEFLLHLDIEGAKEVLLLAPHITVVPAVRASRKVDPILEALWKEDAEEVLMAFNAHTERMKPRAAQDTPKEKGVRTGRQ